MSGCATVSRSQDSVFAAAAGSSTPSDGLSLGPRGLLTDRLLWRRPPQPHAPLAGGASGGGSGRRLPSPCPSSTCCGGGRRRCWCPWPAWGSAVRWGRWNGAVASWQNAELVILGIFSAAENPAGLSVPYTRTKCSRTHTIHRMLFLYESSCSPVIAGVLFANGSGKFVSIAGASRRSRPP